MVFGFFKRRVGAAERAAAPREEAALPPGMRIYAVGDIHGRADLLARLAALIAGDRAERSVSDAAAVFLGDYIDRGPDSRAVLDRLSRGNFPVPVVALRGNHEQMLLDFIDDESRLEDWRQFGGLETLASYGVAVGPLLRGSGYRDAREQFQAALPPEHLEFIAAARTHVAYGGYFFCHAGVRPGCPLEDQSDHDLLWIRNEFLGHPGSFGKIVVHGHTPVEQAEFKANRINIDTGAFATGVLTCLVLERAERRLIAARAAELQPASGP